MQLCAPPQLILKGSDENSPYTDETALRGKTTRRKQNHQRIINLREDQQ
jgi:hypothetical protein